MVCAVTLEWLQQYVLDVQMIYVILSLQPHQVFLLYLHVHAHDHFVYMHENSLYTFHLVVCYT